jgi:hypothetical protein
MFMSAYRLKKILLIIVGLPLLILGLLILYIYVDNTGILVSYDNYVFQKRLKSELYSGKKEIKLKDLTEFEWDTVVVTYEFSHSNSNGACYEDKGSKKNYAELEFYLKNQKVNHFEVRDGLHFLFSGVESCKLEITLGTHAVVPIIRENIEGNELRYLNF